MSNELAAKEKSKELRTYFSSLVTPGLGAAAHIRRFSKRFTRDDLPTFGYPTTPARTCQNIQNSHSEKTNTEEADMNILTKDVIP